MSSKHLSRKCEQCGQPVYLDAPHGECPACLARVALIQAGESEGATPFALAFGRYELLGELGRGGMGAVFRARDFVTGEIVALKLLLEGRLATTMQRERFALEAVAISELRHPRIVALRETGEHDGQPFIAMDLIEGRSLNDTISGGPFKPLEAARNLAQITEAVAHAHKRGFIHRDLKPSNIIVDVGGEPHLTDFGLVRSMVTNGELTMTGEGLGSPSYMAPEQVLGKPGSLTTAADLYALGAILYFMLTGRPPFLAATAHETVTQILTNEAIWPRRLNPSIPRPLQTICLKCLEKNPNHRYASAEDLASDIQQFLDHRPVRARLPSPWRRTVFWCRQNGVATAIAAGVASLVLVAAAVSGWHMRRTEAARALAERAALEANLSNRRLSEALSRMRLQQVEGLAVAGRIPAALALLGQELRQNPSNYVAVDRLIALLEKGIFLLPKSAPVQLATNINSVTLHPNGRFIAIGCYDGFARLFDVNRGKELLSETHPNAWLCANCSADGTKLAAGSSDGVVCVWNVTSGREITPPLRHLGPVVSVEFSPAGDQLAASASGDQAYWVSLWNLATGQAAIPVITNRLYVSRTVFSPDGQRIAAVSTDHQLNLFDTRSGQRVCPPLVHSAGLHAAQFSHDGKRLATSADDGSVTVWDAFSGTSLCSGPRHDAAVLSVEFSPDDSRLVTASADQTGRIINARSGSAVGSPLAHRGCVRSAAFSPDGKLVVTGSDDGTARLWDAWTGLPLSEPLPHGSAVVSARFHHDSSSLITVAKDDKVRVWSLPPRASNEFKVEQSESVIACALNRQATRLIVVGPRVPVRVWDRASGALIRQADKYQVPIMEAWFNPRADRLVTRSEDLSFAIWSVEDGQLLSGPSQSARDGPVPCFSSDGSLLAVGFNDSAVQVWNTQTGQPVAAPLDYPAGRLIKSFALSPRNELLAVGYEWGKLVIWDLSQVKIPARVLELRETVSDLAFSPNGASLAFALAGQGIGFWSTNTATSRSALLTNSAAVQSVRFSQSGEFITALCADNHARVWDIRSGRLLGPILPHQETLDQAELSQTGQLLLTVAGEAVRVWDVGSGRVLADAPRSQSRVVIASFFAQDRRLAIVYKDGTIRFLDALTGQTVSNRQLSGPILFASMGSDRACLLVGSGRGEVSILPLSARFEPSLEWLPDLAEALAGHRVHEDGRITMVASDALWNLKARLFSSSLEGPLDRWVRGWLTGSPVPNESSASLSPSATPKQARLSGQ